MLHCCFNTLYLPHVSKPRQRRTRPKPRCPLCLPARRTYAASCHRTRSPRVASARISLLPDMFFAVRWSPLFFFTLARCCHAMMPGVLPYALTPLLTLLSMLFALSAAMTRYADALLPACQAFAAGVSTARRRHATTSPVAAIAFAAYADPPFVYATPSDDSVCPDTAARCVHYSRRSATRSAPLPLCQSLAR